MKVIGIGGPSGAGKTLLCDYFDKQGFHVIDVDALAHGLYQHQEVIDQVASLFPTACDLGRVNRAKLAEIVFSDQKSLDQLNQLMRPLIQEAVKENIHPDKHTLVDMAILFDTTVVSLCDATVFVTADEMIRKRRLLLRGYTPDTASKMIARQEYMFASAKHASLIIENNDELGQVLDQLVPFLARVTG
jgi:dephospho-CoA kinase